MAPVQEMLKSKLEETTTQEEVKSEKLTRKQRRALERHLKKKRK